MRIRLFVIGVLFGALVVLGEGNKTDGKMTFNLEEGKKIFEMNCIACHGATGNGDTPATASMNPKPKDLSDAAYVKTRPVETLRRIITEGGASEGLSPMMIGWGAMLTPDKVEDVLQYLLTFSKQSSPAK